MGRKTTEKKQPLELKRSTISGAKRSFRFMALALVLPGSQCSVRWLVGMDSLDCPEGRSNGPERAEPAGSNPSFKRLGLRLHNFQLLSRSNALNSLLHGGAAARRAGEC